MCILDRARQDLLEEQCLHIGELSKAKGSTKYSNRDLTYPTCYFHCFLKNSSYSVPTKVNSTGTLPSISSAKMLLFNDLRFSNEIQNCL